MATKGFEKLTAADIEARNARIRGTGLHASIDDLPRHAEMDGIARATPPRSKYRSRKVEYLGHVFDSEKECARFKTLQVLEAAGAIMYLQRQTPFEIYGLNGEVICTYKADFTYRNLETGKDTVEDVKSPFTRKLATYRLKFKLLRAQGVFITEVL